MRDLFWTIITTQIIQRSRSTLNNPLQSRAFSLPTLRLGVRPRSPLSPPMPCCPRRKAPTRPTASLHLPRQPSFPTTLFKPIPLLQPSLNLAGYLSYATIVTLSDISTHLPLLLLRAPSTLWIEFFKTLFFSKPSTLPDV